MLVDGPIAGSGTKLDAMMPVQSGRGNSWDCFQYVRMYTYKSSCPTFVFLASIYPNPVNTMSSTHVGVITSW